MVWASRRKARIATHYRCSTDGREHSVADQRAVVQKEADRHGWTVVEEFVDKGEPGATVDNRPGFLRLLRDAAADRFDVVAVYDSSRMTREGSGPF